MLGRRFYRKYYFHNTSTLLIPFYFITLSIVVFLQQFPLFEIKKYFIGMNFVEALINFTTGFYVFLISSIISLFFILNKFLKKRASICKAKLKKEDAFIINIKNYDRRNIIHREEQQIKLENFFDNDLKDNKYAFFVGKSGSGKTLLIDKYQYCNQENVKRFLADDYYESTLGEEFKKIIQNYNTKKKPHYTIVFDQFEIAFEKKEIFKCIIDFLKETKNLAVYVVFVCIDEDFVKIQKEIKHKIEEDNGTQFKFTPYFLELIKEEKKSIFRQLNERLSFKEEDKRNDYLKSLLDDFSSGYVSMIDINIAKNYFIRTDADEYENILKQNNLLDLSKKDNFEEAKRLIIEDYFERVFAALEDPYLAMVILYSICKYPDGLTLSDFKNLTFAPNTKPGRTTDRKGTLDTILELLREQQLIKKINEENIESPYIMTHKYLIEYLSPLRKVSFYLKCLMSNFVNPYIARTYGYCFQRK